MQRSINLLMKKLRNSESFSEPLHKESYGEPHQLELLEKIKAEIDKVED